MTPTELVVTRAQDAREYLQPWAKALAIKAEGGGTWFNVTRVRATVTDNAQSVTWTATR